MAKIRSTGIHFKAFNSPLVYLVDEAGVRTNFSENFMNMERDFTLDVMYKDCRHGPLYVSVCNNLLSDIESKISETGVEWRLYDLIVVQENIHGFVRYLKFGQVNYSSQKVWFCTGFSFGQSARATSPLNPQRLR